MFAYPIRFRLLAYCMQSFLEIIGYSICLEATWRLEEGGLLLPM